jgi:hypothetical protein
MLGRRPPERNLQVLRYIEAGLRRGLSANRILLELREAGLGIRRQTFLALVREVRGAEQVGNALNFVRYNFKPSAALFQPTEAYLRSRYIVFAEARTRELLDLLGRPVGAAFGFERIPTRGELQERVQDILEEVVETYGVTIRAEDIRFTHAFRRAR